MIDVKNTPHGTPVWIAREGTVTACTFVGVALDLWHYEPAGTVLIDGKWTLGLRGDEIYPTVREARDTLIAKLARERRDLAERLAALDASPVGVR